MQPHLIVLMCSHNLNVGGGHHRVNKRLRWSTHGSGSETKAEKRAVSNCIQDSCMCAFIQFLSTTFHTLIDTQVKSQYGMPLHSSSPASSAQCVTLASLCMYALLVSIKLKGNKKV